ncbi:MAG: hypothetical protein WCJ45_08405 [bacterium]
MKNNILYIASSSTISWAFENTSEILGSRYYHHGVSALTDAQEFVHSGVDIVVMYPFYIGYLDFPFSDKQASHDNLRIFAGYHFWKQELAPKGIKTILVDLHIQHSEYIPAVRLRWKDKPFVYFFDHLHSWESSELLAALIRSKA